MFCFGLLGFGVALDDASHGIWNLWSLNVNYHAAVTRFMMTSVAGHVEIFWECATIDRRSLVGLLEHSGLNRHLTVVLKVVGFVHLI